MLDKKNSMVTKISELFDLWKSNEEKTIDDLQIKSYRNNNVIFTKALTQCKDVTFHNCTFHKNHISDFTFTGCAFIECSFIAVNFTDVEFHSCSITNCLFLKPKFRNTYLNPKNIVFDFNKWKIEASNLNTWLFQQLESNYKSMHQNEFAKNAHIAFRRYYRWQIIRKKTNETLLEKVSKRFKFFSELIYDKSMCYGYGLSNAILTTLLLIIVGMIALDYWWTTFYLTSNVSNLGGVSLVEKLYFLIVTATTLGYGDISPKSSIGMLFVVAILLFSIFWTATITAILVKKIVK